MLDMGFEPQIRRIIAHIPRERQTLFYTATWYDSPSLSHSLPPALAPVPTLPFLSCFAALPWSALALFCSALHCFALARGGRRPWRGCSPSRDTATRITTGRNSFAEGVFRLSACLCVRVVASSVVGPPRAVPRLDQQRTSRLTIAQFPSFWATQTHHPDSEQTDRFRSAKQFSSAKQSMHACGQKLLCCCVCLPFLQEYAHACGRCRLRSTETRQQ